MTELNAHYWQNRYKEQKTGWDIGYPAPALIEYAEKHIPKDKRILIPGAGHAYEAEYLFKKGYTKVTVLDWAPKALEEFQDRFPHFPKNNLVVGDFFEHQQRYDFILEQTFFCALSPQLRKAYVDKMHELLHPQGILVGLLFNFPLTEQGPPFGGNAEMYSQLFSARFSILRLEKAENSIGPRQNNELFFELQKPIA